MPESEIRMTNVAILTKQLSFPDPRQADSEGLVAVGGDFSVERLLLAYRCGIRPIHGPFSNSSGSMSPTAWLGSYGKGSSR